MIDLHQSEREQLRLGSLMKMLPKNRSTILEIGARHGFITRELVKHFDEVTALDLQTPEWRMDRVTPAAGDVRKLNFADNSFDCVLCTEVLEHVPGAEIAAAEIRRVTRHEALIGVPYREDRRLGQAKCSHCGTINPAWGHVNSFDERTLDRMFQGMRVSGREYVSSNRERTNALATWLIAMGGYRHGNYEQEEPCIHCGKKLEPPRAAPSTAKRLFTFAGSAVQRVQYRLNRPRPTWIHTLYRKEPA